jgi:PhnO protein
MNSNLQIRKIQIQDLDFVYKSICELENEELDFELFKEIFNENIANPNNLYLIAENENEVVGLLVFIHKIFCTIMGVLAKFRSFL